jgi:peptide/nickel transport system ATP-binding protein
MDRPAEEVLVMKGLKKYFPTSEKGKYVKAVDSIDLVVRANEVVGLVGESGSGKSTAAYIVMGMYEPTGGTILFKGQDISVPAKKRSLALKKEIQIVFQDPGTSLNPQRTVRKILELPLKVHGIANRATMDEKVAELMEMVNFPEDYLYKYSRILGGGERQLIAIARALATNPSLVVLDEPTSALDVSVQAKIINTLMRLKERMGMSYLFITHDMSLMRNIADRVAIMYLGTIVETAPTIDFFERPIHPYTQMLISSIPVVLKAEAELKPTKLRSQGEIPSPVDIPKGCRFHTRCPRAIDKCRTEEPATVELFPDHCVRCHLAVS